MYKPTDRERQRYVRYTGTNPIPTFRALFGVFGEASAGISHREGQVIRTTAQYVDHVKAAICLTSGCQSRSVTSNITRARY